MYYVKVCVCILCYTYHFYLFATRLHDIL